MPNNNKVGAALVMGAGIGGMQAALDLAESGIKVYLVDTNPSIGGVMSQLDKTFPTNDCAMCTMAPRLVQIGRHKDIEIITLADVEGIEGKPGDFTVTLRKRPRFVDEDKCTGCGTCVTNCPVRNQIYVDGAEKVEIKLEPEDLEKIKRILDEHRGQNGALLPILQDINSAYNYLPENVLRYISEETDISLSLIYRLATFYNAFSLKPKGKYTIRTCMGTACYVKGGKKILEEFERELNTQVGEATEDMAFNIETVNCLGCCGQSPVVTVGEDIYGYMKRAKVQDVLERYNGKGG
jgi:NADH:ubiquinone oxidoreductase subunit E